MDPIHADWRLGNVGGGIAVARTTEYYMVVGLAGWMVVVGVEGGLERVFLLLREWRGGFWDWCFVVVVLMLLCFGLCILLVGINDSIGVIW